MKIRRQELYNKKLSFAVNRYWIERFLWQESHGGKGAIWTLTLLERIKEGLCTVHVEEVATNFIVQIKTNTRDLGVSVKGSIVSGPGVSILKFELLHQ